MSRAVAVPPARGDLRRRFIDYLSLQQKAPRTIQSYTGWIRGLAAFHNRSPDQLGNPEIRVWLLHLITERKLSACSVNLAINALRSFHGGLLGRDIEPLLRGIKRPPRRVQPPRVLSAEEIGRLITVGAAGDPLARVFLMTVPAHCAVGITERQHRLIVFGKHQMTYRLTVHDVP